MAELPRRVMVGFSGGQVLDVRLTQKDHSELVASLGKGGGWTELATEDGPVALDLGEVVFVRTAVADHRVGFGGE